MQRVLGVHDLDQLFVELIDLVALQKLDAREVSVLVEESDLLVRQFVRFPKLARVGLGEHGPNGVMMKRKIAVYWHGVFRFVILTK